MIKKNNHFIPKCLLKRWVTNNGKYDGVNVLDLKTKEISFSTAKGKNAYSFASIDNLYILDKDLERKINLEDWLSGLENSLALFIDKIQRQVKTDFFKKIEHLNLLIMGLISFEFRSLYLFEKGIQFLEENADIANEFNGKSNFQIICENVVNGTTEYANQMPQVEFIVSKSPIPILLGDRPLILENRDQFSIIPLSSEYVLSFKKSTGISTIVYNEITEALANQLNNRIVGNARYWIVSKDTESLRKIRTSNNTTNDEVEFLKIKNLLRGYEF